MTRGYSTRSLHDLLTAWRAFLDPDGVFFIKDGKRSALLAVVPFIGL